ncbi:Transcription factor SRM1 [Cucurbita argyrosperma subsp. argyrosperma]|uniref:Transcription factor SRM1-like n=1 Tax=Cucurbita moschata TaxID=3662 RepID=A0A6J1GXD3_CUCMO|nr:transcription factor SRM1-like [Cucurbita moschata]XP_022956797.1 transcription factor SRM1-like [Cucurbita moschata]XP_022956798.1 transcription factor SRM1-like [Cucurbita moschata]XP_022956799.1 transcription factor SRM1-like [Cucurbita moschata]XP_022956800.1 transcription factor SRM1-like [Cucurbita moschata]XP_022956801.1 transcription factor SRM1-like [Cucurbita moschata]XP_022956802.1 transcription factor SRM1-like [Cucurbita moschata]XP_022956803.1 transcription factor SRM1-like 
MAVDEKSKSSIWSRDQDKAFENALATYPEDAADRWEKIAADIAGRTVEEIKDHYKVLVDDVNQIESGLVPLPCYSFCSDGSPSDDTKKKGDHHGVDNSEPCMGNKAPRSDQERRKGTAWTEDEHRLFLLGLDKYGKGDWRSISRNFVVTRTPTQVASHAQKYFIRLNSMNKDRRRSSIHDITRVDNGDVSAHQGPITGEANSSGGGGGSSTSNSSKQPSQPPTGSFDVGIYGALAVEQPVGGPFGPAVATPVSTPPAAHTTYAVRSRVVNSLVRRPPVNMSSITY